MIVQYVNQFAASDKSAITFTSGNPRTHTTNLMVVLAIPSTYVFVSIISYCLDSGISS